MEKQVFTVGERIDKFCAVCAEERGHIVASVTKRGEISRVSCPKCNTVSAFKLASRTSPRPAIKTPAPYDRTITYRAGQSMTHEMFGVGEVTRLIEPRKMEVLFQDRLRRLIHAQGHE
jgi:ssDNA-binding Zn-finger/Zn-ribbon topoisomerase 1